MGELGKLLVFRDSAGFQELVSLKAYVSQPLLQSHKTIKNVLQYLEQI